MTHTRLTFLKLRQQILFPGGEWERGSENDEREKQWGCLERERDTKPRRETGGIVSSEARKTGREGEENRGRQKGRKESSREVQTKEAAPVHIWLPHSPLF
jgi:hypothetical protein